MDYLPFRFFLKNGFFKKRPKRPGFVFLVVPQTTPVLERPMLPDTSE